MFIMKSTILLIDAGYLSHISKYFGEGEPLKYRLENFAINVCKDLKLSCKEIYFYVAPPFKAQNQLKKRINEKLIMINLLQNLKKFFPKLMLKKEDYKR